MYIHTECLHVFIELVSFRQTNEYYYGDGLTHEYLLCNVSLARLSP